MKLWKNLNEERITESKFWKLNNSVHELFIFQILLIAIDWNCCTITYP